MLDMLGMLSLPSTYIKQQNKHFFLTWLASICSHFIHSAKDHGNKILGSASALVEPCLIALFDSITGCMNTIPHIP